MDKILVVAATEFGTAIRTKAFLVGLLLMPVLMGGSILIQTTMARRVDADPRPFAVIDRSGELYPAIAEAAKAYNAAMVDKAGKPTAPPFEPSQAQPPEGDDRLLRLDLSEKVRKHDLFAFVEIPAEVLKPDAPDDATLRYYSDNPNDDKLLDWLVATVNASVRDKRYRAEGIDPVVAARLTAPIGSENLGLLTRAAPGATGSAEGGEVVEAAKVDKVRTFLVPAILLFVLFIVVMSTTPQLLNSVIEEKMSKISEVLLGSLSPFELMMGKLLGNVAIALVLATLYVGGGYGVACYFGYGDVVPPQLFPLLAFFLVLAIVLFGSLFMAVGSACSEIKDAQSLMMPVMLLLMLPLFVWLPVLQAPSSPMAVGLSMFPPCTPFLMLTRMLLRPEPPIWQVAVSALLTTLTALACVWAGSRIFRVGLLMQGKPPSFREMARWVVSK